MTRINHASNFSWQVQYLVMLEGNHSVAPRIVNDVSYVARINHESNFSWQAQYFVAGAAVGEIWNDGRSAKSCIFQEKVVGARKITSVARRVVD